MREVRPAVVHGYLLRGNFYAALAARAAGVPVVITSKRGLHRPAGAAESAAVAVSNRLSDTVTGNSDQVLAFTREVEGKFRAPMVMIPSGIDSDRFDPARVGTAGGERLRSQLGLTGKPVFGSIMTFRPRKGFRMLFEAMGELLRRVPDVHLLFAGESEMPPEPAALAAALGITDRVHLLGRRSDMPDVLAAMDAFVLPSESEGMSNAILEAMSMRLPVVVTAVGGAPEVITEGVDGFLVGYPDSAAMADRLAHLFGDEALRRRVGEAARARVVETYSAAGMVRQIEQLYVRLLDGKKR